jgi:hypothetical protein
MSAYDAEAALRHALVVLGLAPTDTTRSDSSGADLTVDVDDRRVSLELKYYSLVDLPRATHLSRLAARPTTPENAPVPVVISDRIVEQARQELRQANVSWFDLRGHLFLSAPGLRVDVDTPRSNGGRRSQEPITGRVGLATAIDILLQGPQAHASVRDIARRIRAAPSSVSVAMKALREANFMDKQGTADLPALFWATAPHWTPHWVAVSRYPHPDGPMRNPALQIGFDDTDGAGWALTGDLAAAALGAPLGVPSGAPPQLYVPTRQAHRLAISILEESSASASPQARLAVVPVHAACEQRIDAAGWHNQHWLLARTLFVALDLAQDPGRGTEILRDWHPSVGGDRVW